MRDFPLFTTENGVGSLVLREIPYRGIAYITIQDSLSPELFLKECTDFCRVAGAECVYATGHSILEEYPLYTSVIRMSADASAIPETDASVFPVTEKTVNRWREIYNEKMKTVHNASYMSERDGDELLKTAGAYFIHRDGALLGIGKVTDDHIDCVASCMPGGGREVVAALQHVMMCDRVTLDVASTNAKAIRLYESLGFVAVSEVSRWHKII